MNGLSAIGGDRPLGIYGNTGIAAGGCMGPTGCRKAKLGKLKSKLRKGCKGGCCKAKRGAAQCSGGPGAIGEIAKRMAEMTQGLLTGRCACC